MPADDERTIDGMTLRVGDRIQITQQSLAQWNDAVSEIIDAHATEVRQAVRNIAKAVGEQVRTPSSSDDGKQLSEPRCCVAHAWVTRDTYALLELAAHRRGLHVDQLVAALVEHAAYESTFNTYR